MICVIKKTDYMTYWVDNTEYSDLDTAWETYKLLLSFGLNPSWSVEWHFT